MRIVVAPDKFKACLSAAQVASAIAEGLRAADPSAEIDLCPMADGGEGTVDALVAATKGTLLHRKVTGPRADMKVDATFGILGDGQTAVIEMSAASGLHLLSPDQRDPTKTTTYGTGQLLLAAAELKVKRIILGIGGSATTDGGLGCAQACGLVSAPEAAPLVVPTTAPAQCRSLRPHDKVLTGADLESPLLVTPVALSPLAGIEIIVACDVTNPLYGPEGAARIFGPQKGATATQVEALDRGLEKLAQRLNKVELAQTPGAGAAGGLGFGMLAFFGASLKPGVQIVIDAVRLRERLMSADLCITGEGRLDSQSLGGKTPIGISRLCMELGVPCIALAGAIGDSLEDAPAQGLTAAFSICDGPMSLQQSVAHAPRLLQQAAAQILRVIQSTSPARDRTSPRPGH